MHASSSCSCYAPATGGFTKKLLSMHPSVPSP